MESCVAQRGRDIHMSLCVCLADAGVTPGGLVLRLALPLALAASPPAGAPYSEYVRLYM